MGKPFIDRTGLKYGYLTALEYLGKPSSASKTKWRCKCDCGNITDVTTSNLGTGHTLSCGCLTIKKAKERRIYPKKYTKEYQTWRGIKQRGLNPRGKNKEWYADISICQEWVDSFDTFLKDMGTKPTSRHTIERIDNKKGYEPSNCAWVLPKTQANNRSTNRLITFNGTTQTLQQWSDQTGIAYSTIAARIDRYNWSIDDALTVAVGNKTCQI